MVAVVLATGAGLMRVAGSGGKRTRTQGVQSLGDAAASTTISTTQTTTTVTFTPDTTADVVPDPPIDPGPPKDPAVQAKIAATTKAFILAWLHPGTPKERTASLKSLTTIQLLPQVANLPADALPQGHLTDVTVTTFDDATATASASLSNGVTALCLLVATSGGHWQVSGIDRSAGPITTTSTSLPSD